VSWWFLAVLLAWAAIVVFRRKRERRASEGWQPPPARGGSAASPLRDDPDIDRDTLEAAEREVKDLETDVRGRPLEDAVGDDWGPGTPKPPYI